MLRLLLILSPLVCVPALVPAAPVPRAANKPVYYFPTQVGTKWVYDKIGGDEEGHSNVVIESEERNGQFLVTVRSRLVRFDEGGSYAQYAVSKDGVFLVWRKDNFEDPATESDPLYCVLKLPHKDGNIWENEEDKLWHRKNVAKKVEIVAVPAGTFEAIRVESGKYTSWYAPGVGVVKQNHGRVTIELKSFELPK